jgi:hypothetical protein
MKMDEFLTMLATASDRLDKADFRPALRAAGEQFSDEVAGNFLREEDSDGNPWAPHAPLTIALHGVHPLLRLSYAMYRAATDLDAATALQLLEDRKITIGIDGNQIPYAWKQDEGAGRIPAREFFYLSGDSVERVGEAIEEAGFDVVNSYVFPD